VVENLRRHRADATAKTATQIANACGLGQLSRSAVTYFKLFGGIAIRNAIPATR
jgi:hypothetical protein